MAEGVYYIPDEGELKVDDDLFDDKPRRGRGKGRRGGGKRRRRWPWLLALLLLAGLTYLLRIQILIGVGHYLDTSDRIETSDHVMVLGGRPSIRPFYAAALYRAGLAGAVIVTQPEAIPDVIDGIYPAEHDLTQQILAHGGVFPVDVIVLPGEVTSTLDEARALAGFLAGNPNARVTVLTSAYHTRRARQIIDSALDDAAFERVRMLGVPEEGFSANDWWRSQEGLIAHLGELIKIPYNWLIS